MTTHGDSSIKIAGKIKYTFNKWINSIHSQQKKVSQNFAGLKIWSLEFSGTERKKRTHSGMFWNVILQPENDMLKGSI